MEDGNLYETCKMQCTISVNKKLPYITILKNIILNYIKNVLYLGNDFLQTS